MAHCLHLHLREPFRARTNQHKRITTQSVGVVRTPAGTTIWLPAIVERIAHHQAIGGDAHTQFIAITPGNQSGARRRVAVDDKANIARRATRKERQRCLFPAVAIKIAIDYLIKIRNAAGPGRRGNDDDVMVVTNRFVGDSRFGEQDCFPIQCANGLVECCATSHDGRNRDDQGVVDRA